MSVVTIVIQNAPYQDDNKVWHALRFAGAAMTEIARKKYREASNLIEQAETEFGAEKLAAANSQLIKMQ